MKATEILTKAGDQVLIDPSDLGMTIGVLPAKPPFGIGFVDFFSHGLKFTSLARMHAALQSGIPFESDDKTFAIKLADLEVVMEFRPTALPGKSFKVECDQETTAQLIQIIEGHLGGQIAVSSIPPIPKRGMREGRNKLCHCGSGRRKKDCCRGKESNSDGWVELQALCAGLEDDLVQEKLEIGRNTPMALQDPEFWGELGCDLGSFGRHDLAERAFEHALQIDPRDVWSKLNLAVTFDVLGKTKGALELLENIPEDTERLAVIKANILHGQGNYEEAIPLYEKAIKEEPTFDLPYARLCESLSCTASPLLDYWLFKSIEVVQDSPLLAVQLARHLFLSQRLEELATADWIDRLSARVGDTRMIGRRANEPQQVVEAQLWKACGELVANPNALSLERAMNIEMGYRALGGHCDPSKILLSVAVNLGDEEKVENIYSKLCEPCQAQMDDMEFLKACSAHARQDWTTAISRVESYLGKSPEHKGALSIYWWALDELGLTEESLKIAEKLMKLDPTRDNIAFNLGFLSGKIGYHGKSEYYYKIEIEKDQNHPFAMENLIVAQILNGSIIDSRSTFDKLTKNKFLVHKLEDENKINQIIIFQNKAESIMGSATYLKEMIEFKGTLDPTIGSDVKVPTNPFPLSEILLWLVAADEAVRAEAVQRLRSHQQGDYSDVFAKIEKEIPSFDHLPTEAKYAIYEADRRLAEGGGRDYSPEVVAYAKAVEVCMKSLVFDSFKIKGIGNVDISDEIQQASDEKFKQAVTFVQYIKKGPFIELGGMAHTLRLIGGRTADDLWLLGMFRSYIKEVLRVPRITDKQFSVSIDELIKLRNPAAHSALASEASAMNARKLAIELLREISPLFVAS